MIRHRAGSKPAGGFTLVELLVVIAILGVLATVVVVAVNGITDRGETAACESDARVLRTAEESYFAQNGAYADEATLVSAGLLAQPSTLHDINVSGATYSLTATGACGTVAHNDGFEPPEVTAANANRFYTRSAPSTFGPWTINSGSIDVVHSGYWGSVATMGISAGNTIDLHGSSRGSIQRTFTGFTPGDTYTLTFKYAANGGNATARIRIGNLDRSLVVTIPANRAWAMATYQFVADAESQTLRFDGSGPSANRGVALDDIAIN